MSLMSKPAKKKKIQHSECSHDSETRITKAISGILCRPEKNDEQNSTANKIIFLEKENLEKLRGYKAFLDLWVDGQVFITITGLSPKSGLALFKSLNEINLERK